MIRHAIFDAVKEKDWQNWQWQMKHSLSHNDDIKKIFPNLPDREIKKFNDYVSKYKFRVTPYLLSMLELDSLGNPVTTDPIWRQFTYFDEPEDIMSYEDKGDNENWENEEEMPTRILQHKYDDRAIIRITSTCFGHCNYCYLTSRVLDHETSRLKSSSEDEWRRSLEYLRKNPQIRDVLISGGDPLILTNERIEEILSALRSIRSIQTIRLNTRVFTFNPFRFDITLVNLFKKYRLTALEVHMCHSKELTEVVDARLDLMDQVGYRPLILWRAPLIKGINDSEEVLEQLFVELYKRRITPYYLFHYAPFTLGRKNQGVPMRDGSQIMKKLRRKVPGPAFPTYTLFHIEGKQDIPLDKQGTSSFKYEKNNGKVIARFENWKGNTVTYEDVEVE